MGVNETANNKARNRLIAYMQEGHAIALTAAGLSAWAGYPQWTELLRRLVDYISEHGDGTPAEKARAEEIINTHQNPLKTATQLSGMLTPYDFSNFINEQLGPKPQRFFDLILLVATLPFRHFITLNLDPTLYDALLRLNTSPFDTLTWYQTGGMIKFLKSLSAPPARYPRQLIYWHGRHFDPLDSIALTTEGYNELYGRELFKWYLTTLAMTQRIVFVGFGFKDTNFLEPFRIAAQQTRTLDLCHFAIVPLAENEEDQKERNRYRDEWCVEPIFYAKQAATDGHGGFGQFRVELQRIRDELKITPAKEVGMVQHAAPTTKDPEDSAIAEAVTEATLREIRGDGDV